MKTFIKKRIMPWLLSAALIAGTAGAPVYATGTEPLVGGLCEHHPEHTADCGYSEGTPCTHEHNDDCYQKVENCVHEHTPECYPEAEDTDDEATPSNAKAAEPTECTHVCGEDTGCITKALDCQHEHDDSCGSSEGTPCGYVCEICANADKPAGGNETEPKEPEIPACICEELCTEDSVNESCPVCGMDGADLADCNGKQPAPDQENGLSVISYDENEYSKSDVDVINAIIDNNGLSATKDDPASWKFATWYGSSPKRITRLDLDNASLQGTLDVSGLASLTELYCNNNQLGTLNVSGLAILTYLYCNNNQLGTLDVSGLSSLTTLTCFANQLGMLDVSKNTALTWLNCNANQLGTLDVSNTALTDLFLADNPLTSFTSKDGKSLTITPSVNGTVKMTSVDLTDGTKINLTVTLDPGYIVTGLPEGTDTSANAVTFTLNNDVTAKVKKLLTADMIAAIPAQTYTGSAIEPALTVTDGSPTIIQQSDYTVSYTDNTEVGTATATITATADGNYSGSASKTFAIVKADSVVGEPAISPVTYDQDFTVTFTPKLLTQKNFFARTFSRSATAEKTAELYFGDTLLATQNNVTENTKVTFTVKADNRIPSSAFDGTAQTFTIRWGGDDNLNASEGSVTATLNKKALTGEVVSPTSKVYDGTNSFTGVALTLTGVVSGDTVTATATGTAAGTGVGTHAFTATQTTLGGADVGYYSLAASDVSGSVEITQKPLADTMIAAIPAQTYTGSAVEPALTVTDGSPTIIQQSDYTVSYTDNTEVGTATATITATADGNYSGSASKTFAIVKADSVVGEPAISPVTYDQDFTVTFTPKLLTQKNFFARTFSRSATAEKTAELYFGDTLLATQNNVTENTKVTFTVKADNRIPSSAFDGTAQTFTIRWGGDDNLNASEGSVTATLNKKALTGEVVSPTSKVYDGTNSFTGVALTLTGVVSGDTVTATADGTSAVTDAGTYAFTATQTTLGGADAGYYSLAANAVSGSVTITEKDVTATGRNDSRNVVVNSGTFAEPVFDGENGEKVTGTFTYNYNGKTTYAEVVTELKGLAKDAEASVDFTFTANGNYTGTITGTLTMKVVGLEFSTVGAVTPAANPVYGSDWNTLLNYDAGKLSVTLDSVPVSGTYTFTVDGAAYNGAAVPRVGSYSYRLTFTTADNTFTDVEVLSGNITVAQREAALSWSNTTLTYNGSVQKPTVTISNKVDSDDVAATVTGEQTNAGDGYTATVSGLTGTSAANYKLPAVTDTTFRIQPAAPAGEVTISGDDANTNNKLDTGDTVTADISAITPAGGTAACQWKKTVGGTTTDLGTGATYTLDGDDTRGKIFCVVTFSGNVTGTKESNKLDIAKELLRGTITISGNTAEGSVLTVSTPANTGIMANDYTIAWYRDGAAIDAHETSYTVTDKDLGKTLKVIVTAAESSEGFTGALTSNEIAIPATAPGKPVITLKPDNGKITVSWAKVSDNGSALTGYSLSVKQGGTDITGSPFAIDAGATSHTVNGLTNGTEYTFVLTAINGIGSTASDAKTEKPKTSGGSSGGGNGGGSSGNGSSGSASSGSASSGSGDSSSSGDSNITTPPAQNTIIPTKGNIKADGKVDANGNAVAAVTDKAVNDAIKKALAEAKKNGSEANGVTLVLHVSTGGKTANSITVNLPKTVQETIISKKIVNTVVVVDQPAIQIDMDLSVIKEISRQANGDVNLTATRQDNSKLTGEAKAAIGNRPVFDLTVTYGSGKQVTDFGTGGVSVAIPYTLGKGEAAGGVYAVYVDDTGKVEWLTKSSYNAGQKALIFEAEHFSIYGVGYKYPVPAFTDIKGHWAEDNIIFAASRGLLTGTGKTTFSPNTGMTRGMFVTALGRMANVDTSQYKKVGFSDVPADACYAPYVNWAAEKGIVAGTDTAANTFSPDLNINREQMAVILANYAKKLGCTIPKTLEAVTFADNAQISGFAAAEVKAMQQAGIFAGKDGNRFDPQAVATRAEAATVLRRFVEVIIDPQTANGWTQNDSGEWSYYKDGEPVKGWLSDDQKWYWLDATGKMFSGGWKQIGGKWYYFYADGSMAASTVIDGRKVGADGAEM